MVVPATNFGAAFPNVGYRGIRNILNEYRVNYTKYTIIQSSDVKKKLEALEITKDEATVVSIDAVCMYPSITCKMVRKAIYYFLSQSTKEVNDEDRKTIDKCLDLIQFGMGSTFLAFADQYYEYDGLVEVEDRGLTIGGYESAWLADLVVSFIFENTTQHFEDAMCNGCYRDDELGVFKGNKSRDEMLMWLEDFQNTINLLLESENLQFTLTLWKPGEPDERYHKKIKVCSNEAFPFLDLEMFWKKGELNHRVHLKENQKLKYLNRESSHTHACFKAIPNGVLGQLATITTYNDETKHKKNE